MPELTVSMPAYNTGRFIGRAIESVLQQQGIDFELIVVDDGSQDNTAEVVRSFHDPRVRLIRNTQNRGIAYCHNLVIDQSTSPFIAHVDSDDIVLPGAFQKLVAKLKSDPMIGQAHCYSFAVNEQGKTTPEAFRRRKELLLTLRPPDMDYKRELLVQGSVMNHLRTYRREVFQVVGRFNEKLRYGEDLEMGLRIIDKYKIALVPEFLYCVRKHQTNTSRSLRFKPLRFWLQRLVFCCQLTRKGQLSFVKQRQYAVTKFMLVGLASASGLPKLLSALKRIARIPWKAR
jgi:glycosyltransferase involved in cell wall biosynthesis